MSAPLILLPGLSRVRRNLVTYLLTYKNYTYLRLLVKMYSMTCVE